MEQNKENNKRLIKRLIQLILIGLILQISLFTAGFLKEIPKEVEKTPITEVKIVDAVITPKVEKDVSKTPFLPSESPSKIQEYIESKSWDYKIAYAVMMAESGGKPQAISKKPNRNGTIDKGLFQINSVHNETNLFDWKHNIDVAYQIYRDRKKLTGVGWEAWSVYNNKKYKEWLK